MFMENKKLCFYHTKLKMFARPRAKEERKKEKKKKNGGEGERCVVGQGKKKGLCCVKMKKERGVYVGVGEGLGFGH